MNARFGKLAVLVGLAALPLLAAPPATAEEGLSFALGISTRSTYTRWYEYPGNYYEEDYGLRGVHGEVGKVLGHWGEGTLRAGLGLSYWPLGSYQTGGNEKADARGGRVSLFGQYGLPLGQNARLLFRAALAYQDLGGDDIQNDPAHDSGVGSYLTTLDGAVGLAFPGVRVLGSKGMSLLYGFPLVGLNVETDTYIQNTPDSEDWSSTGFMFMLHYGP